MADDLLSLFNFEVHLTPSGRGGDEGLTRTAAFSEVRGLETIVEVREVREGGFNTGVRRLLGKTSHPSLVLRRGVTLDLGFWRWIQRCTGGGYPLPYVCGSILQFASGETRDPSTAARWRFTNAVVTRVRSADLHAGSSRNVAIEELFMVHEGLERVS